MKKNDNVVNIGGESEKARLFGESGPDKDGRRITFSKILCIFSDVLLAYCIGLTTYSVVKYFTVMESLLYVNAEMGYTPQFDMTFLGFLLPAAFVFTGLTHTFYYNKERFANCIKIRFEYIKELLMFKLNSGLYDKEVLIQQIDSVIDQAEMEADALISSDITSTEQEQENISV